MKRAAQVAGSLLGLVLVIVGVALLALWASGALAAKQVPGAPTPAVAPAPVAAMNAPAMHEVVVSVTGAPGAQFRVRGEVFGDTGPINLPDSGADSARFRTGKSAEQLNLVVYVAAPIGDTTVGCAISYDGKRIATTERVPLEHTNTVACRVTYA